MASSKWYWQKIETSTWYWQYLGGRASCILCWFGQYLWWGVAQGQWESHKYPFCKIYIRDARFICFPPLYYTFWLYPVLKYFRIGINIYFVRNTHLLHRRNIICRTEDTWLSQNRRYILLKEAILYDYISFFLPKSRSNLKYLAVCQFKYFKYLVTYLTSENLAHSWKWKFLQNEKRLEN